MVGFKASAPTLQGGEKLCEAYEIYREWEPEVRLEFDQAVLLAMGAMKGEDIVLSSCPGCGGALLMDKRGKARTRCARCRSKRARRH